MYKVRNNHSSFLQYFQGIDKLVECIHDRFNQPSYKIYMNLELLVLNACKDENYDEELKNVLEFSKKKILMKNP